MSNMAKTYTMTGLQKGLFLFAKREFRREWGKFLRKSG